MPTYDHIRWFDTGTTTSGTRISNLVDRAWDDWVSTGITTSSNTNTDWVWDRWHRTYNTIRYSTNSTGTGTGTSTSGYEYDPAPPPPSAEELERRRRAAAQTRLRQMWERWKREAASYWWRRDRDEAEWRAETLLFECLSDGQRIQYLADKYFTVHTAMGNVYKIEYGNVGNVFLINGDGVSIQKYCIHLVNDEPIPDTMLAQKLLLETDEEQFLSVANRHW